MIYEPLYEAFFAKALKKEAVAVKIASIPEFNPNCDITMTGGYTWVRGFWDNMQKVPQVWLMRPAMIAAERGWHDLASVLVAREDTNLNFVFDEKPLLRGCNRIERRSAIEIAKAHGHDTIVALYEDRLQANIATGAAILRAQEGRTPALITDSLTS